MTLFRPGAPQRTLGKSVSRANSAFATASRESSACVARGALSAIRAMMSYVNASGG
jgi:hypothetical protein